MVKLNAIIDLINAFLPVWLHKVNSIDTDQPSCRMLLTGWQHIYWESLSILLVMNSLIGPGYSLPDAFVQLLNVS